MTDPALRDLVVRFLHNYRPNGDVLALTLTIPGGTFSGYVVTVEEFANLLNHAVVSDTNMLDDLHGETTKFALYLNEFAKADMVQGAEEYVHLSEALLIAPAQPSTELGHVRISLSEVTAWTVGYHKHDWPSFG